MQISQLALATAFLTLFSISALAVDYTVDPSFNPTFQFPDFNQEKSISDIVNLPDGKLLIAGTFSQVNGVANRYLARLNADGTLDPTFHSGLNEIAAGYAQTIKLLPGGKLLVTGQFYVGTQYSSYARLNSDGSVDPGMQLAPIGRIIEPLADGKFLVCGGRAVNDESYWISHRLNADGSVDPSYRVTFATGTCQDMAVLPDGKILMAGVFHNESNYYYKPLHRFNPDGSKDLTFDLEVPEFSAGNTFSVQPDGKILFAYSSGSQSYVKRFNANGSVDINFPNCGGWEFLPLANGDVLTNGCRKWPTGLLYKFAKVKPDGALDPSLDWIDIDGTVYGFRDGSGGKYYVFGVFERVGNVPRYRLARMMPYSAPVKPKFDFDGDGKSDYAVFRPSDRYWYLYRSTAGSSQFQWGLPTDSLIAGDYDWDGKTDPGVFRNGIFHAYTSIWGYSWVEIGYTPGKALTGDFNNDGKDDWVVRRPDDVVAFWQLRFGGASPVIAPLALSVAGEVASDKPVIGDFDGDGRDEIGSFRDGLWLSRDYGSGAPTSSFQWGMAGDIPVPDDYDGDGQTDYAVYRPSTGVWWINRSTEGIYAAAFGVNTDTPVPADYDGDGRADIAIYRNGQWWQFMSGSGSVSVANWGTAGDVPIPSQHQ